MALRLSLVRTIMRKDGIDQQANYHDLEKNSSNYAETPKCIKKLKRKQ